MQSYRCFKRLRNVNNNARTLTVLTPNMKSTVKSSPLPNMMRSLPATKIRSTNSSDMSKITKSKAIAKSCINYYLTTSKLKLCMRMNENNRILIFIPDFYMSPKKLIDHKLLLTPRPRRRSKVLIQPSMRWFKNPKKEWQWKINFNQVNSVLSIIFQSMDKYKITKVFHLKTKFYSKTVSKI